MATPTFTKTPGGDEIVILLREDYERLVAAASAVEEDDDAADIALATRRRDEWERAGKPVVPLQIMRMVRAGDTYMRAFRRLRGITQEGLSEQTGIAQGFLSDIEGARKSASVATLTKIADALDMHVTFLMPASDAGRASKLG